MDKEFYEHLKEVNATFYDQVKIADQKAAYIFSFMLAMLIWSSEARAIYTVGHYQGASLLTVVLSVAAGVSQVVTLLSAVMVVTPRRVKGGSSLFWGDWDDAGLRLKDAEARGDKAALAEEYRTNIRHLAAIARAKYRFVNVAFRALMAAVVTYLTMLALA